MCCRTTEKPLLGPSDIHDNARDPEDRDLNNNSSSSSDNAGISSSESDDNIHRSPDRGADNSQTDYNSQNETYSPYTFNGKVVIGIAIILVVSAASAIAASSVSTSPVIRLTSQNPFSSSSSNSHAAAAAQSPEQASANTKHTDKHFVLVAHDFGFNGTTGGPTIQVTKGDTVQITFINAGHMAHNFGMAKLSAKTSKIIDDTKNMPIDQRVRTISYDVMAAMPCPECQEKFDEGHIERFVLPDQQQTTTFTANESGHFNYFCQVRGHIWMGMMGDLIVVDKPTSSAKGGSNT